MLAAGCTRGSAVRALRAGWRSLPGACLLLAGLAAAGAVRPAEPPPEDLPLFNAEPFMLKPCELQDSAGRGRVPAECGRLRVPENPDDPRGRRIELFVARVPALRPDPAADAVTLVNGGPGGSSVSLYVELEAAFADLRRNRDIVLVDQRGTGRSAPLDCPSLEEATYEFDLDAIRHDTRACLETLERDPRLYTTSLAVTDLETVRRALGYRQWNLYGVSYGTRVVQHYLARFPDAVRTMVIDGVVPRDLTLGPDVALRAQQTLDAVLERCAQSASCAAAFPDLRRRLETLSEDLKGQPVAIRIPDPTTGRITSVTLHYAQLAMSLRMLSYAPETAALIPLIIHEAAVRANFLPLAAQALRIEQGLTASISFGMHNSVVCTEDVPFYHDVDALWPALEGTYLGANQVRALQAICEIWPAGVLHPSLRQSARATRPVLLLSGEFDPITPPAYAQRAAADYPNSLHLVARGQGHGVVARGCIPALVADFIDTATIESLETSCLDRLQADAFFVDLLGPPP